MTNVDLVGRPQRARVGHVVQQSLVDLVDVSLLAKQVHWNVTGPRFRALHLQLDEIVEVARDAADAVAERAVILGVVPDGRALTVAATSRILAGRPDGMPVGPIADNHAIEIVHGILTQAIEGLADAIDVTGGTDPVTQDLLIGVSAGLEKHRWMLDASR